MFRVILRSSYSLKLDYRSMRRLPMPSRYFSTNALERARVLVVGSGRMGKIRAKLVRANPKFELAGIVDTDMNAAASLALTYGGSPHQSLSEAIDKTRADGIIISTPTFTHASLIKEAADKGASIFTEKPVDETADKIEMLFDYCNKKGIDLCCGFQRRFDPSYVAVSEAVKIGKIGTPVMANIFFADHPVPDREFLLKGGNIFMDLLAHDCDFICNTLEDDILSVYATGTSSDEELVKAGVHDNATVLLKTRKGTVVTIFMSRSATYGYDQRCEIFGSKGLVSLQNVHENSAVVSTQDGIHMARLQQSFPERFNEAFALEIDSFAETLLRHKRWPVTADHCIKVQKVADAASASAKTGNVVQLL